MQTLVSMVILSNEFAGSVPGQFRSLYRIKSLPPNNCTLSFPKWIQLTLFCAFSTICQNLPAASYFVAKTGSDSNPGSAALPFLTVQKGVNTAQAGDTVLVGAGNYSENVTSTASGTSGNPIVLDGQGVATLWSFLATHHHLEFRNWTVAGKASGWWFWMGKGAHYCVLSNNIFDGGFNDRLDRMLRWDSPEIALLPWGTNCASDVLVISNTFKRAIGTTAIEIFGDHNVIHGNRLIDGDAVDWFHVWGRSNRIVGNLCSNAFVSGVSANHPDFIQTFGLNGAGAIGNIIENNTVVASHGDSQLCMFEGQDCQNLRDFTFRNNLFIGVSSKGTIACPEVSFYNNIFVDCSTNPITAGPVLIFTTATNSTWTNVALNSGHSGKVFNNVFLNCGGTASDKGWYAFDTSLSNIEADYNFVSKNGYTAVVEDSLQRAIGNPGGWDKFKWWEPHGINGGDPLFVNASKWDFRLLEGSLLVGKALPRNQLFQTDMRGILRGAQWDVGPFEFRVGETDSLPVAPSNLRVLRVSSP
jgi:hypothetical protein